MLVVLLLLLIVVDPSCGLVQLKTRTTLAAGQHYSLHDQVGKFLATPSNWPTIVASSWSVESSDDSTRIDIPLQVKSQVTEIFGLPPILPLEVTWTCVKSTSNCLDVVSKQGVPGLATDCRMLFELQTENLEEKTVIVELTMEYEPANILGKLAIPLLSLDNALALKVLLPYQLQQQQVNKTTPLVKFQQLMGVLYGVAGVAHFVDLCFGDSQILQLAGCPSFGALSVAGQVLALLWCAAGPVAFVTSRIVGLENVGLVGYGVMEVFCAAIVVASATTITDATGMNPLVNALGVQAIVAASYKYSSQKTLDEADSL